MSLPVANFTVNHTVGIAPLPVVFNDTSTGDVTGRVWSFGDGQTSHNKQTSHEFREGNWKVTLTVWNAEGADSKTLEIEATAPDVAEASGLATSMMDLVPSVRRLLRGTSDLKLHYTVIIETALDVLRGYARDLSVNDSDDQKDEHPAQMSFIKDGNYLLTVQGAPELEAIALKYRKPPNPNAFDQFVEWNVPLVPYNYYADRQLREQPIASLYGGLLTEEGSKIKINLPRAEVESSIWTVTTRLPILQTVTISSPLQLRSDFLRMLKVETAIKCIPMVRDDSKSWVEWVDRSLKMYVGELAEWRGRWADYLENNNKPQFAPKRSANDYRGYGYNLPRYSIEKR